MPENGRWELCNSVFKGLNAVTAGLSNTSRTKGLVGTTIFLC
jgi:hypothetical protein